MKIGIGCRAGALGRILVMSCVMTFPALCAAQHDPASRGARAPANAASASPLDAVRDLFDWLLNPRPASAIKPGPAASVEGNADAAMPAGRSEPVAPLPSAGPAAAGARMPESGTPPQDSVSGSTAAREELAVPAAPAAGTDNVPKPAELATAPVTAAPVEAAKPATLSGVALILPAKTSPFGRAGEVARQGFMAARAIAADKSEVRIFETDGTGESARQAFEKAVASHAGVIVGPLTKAEVTGIIGRPLAVPTLALNTPDGDAALPHNLFALSLNIESEARAAAAASYRSDAGSAVVVTSGAPLARRAAAAFADAWVKLGGVVKETVEYTGNASRVRQAVERARADMVFLAADAERARLIRPYLGRNTPVIGTSQVFAGSPRTEAQKPHDLNGLRFVDMPWLHQPDHAATMIFPRPEAQLAADLERLYALGIDAYRVAGELARAHTEFTLDGVTGTLTVRAGVILREPLQVEYRDGAVSPSPSR